MTIDISDNDPRISYTANANGAQTAFAVPFEFFDNADLNVYIASVLKSEGTGSTNYGVSGGSGSTGTVTFVSGVTASATVVITRSISIERVTDFTAGADINRAALNTQLDTLTAITADLKDTAARALQLTDSDAAAASLVLPAVADRKGKVLAFHATTGAVESGPSTSAVQSVADNATAVNLLGTAAVVEDMGLLSTAAAVEDMSILGTSAIVADMAILATSDIVADMAILATSDIVADMAILGTSAVVADMAILGTSDVVSDMNDLATSANIAAINTVSANLSGITAFSAVYSSGGTDPSSNLDAGDLFYNTTSDSLKVYTGSAWTTGVTAGSGFLSLADGGTISASVTIGANDQGYDFKLFGDTASAYLLWDTSADKLLTAGGATIDIVKDKLLIGGTAVTSTAAELNTLDALSRGSILYGNASAATTVLTKGAADTVLTSDGTDISWAAAGGAFAGATVTVTANTTLSAAQNGNLVNIAATAEKVISLPAAAAGAFYIFNNDTSHIMYIKPNGSNTINGVVAALSLAPAASGTLACGGSTTNWSSVGLTRSMLVAKATTITNPAIDAGTANQITGTYTRLLGSSMLICVGSSTAGAQHSGAGSYYYRSGAPGGPSYSEKFIASPASSYAYTISGAGSSSKNNNDAATKTTIVAGMTCTRGPGPQSQSPTTANVPGRTGGTASGGTVNFTGGTGATPSATGNTGRNAGGGGAATRAGNGGNGALNAGGGTAGNNASQDTAGAAATAKDSNSYAVPNTTSETYQAGTAFSTTGTVDIRNPLGAAPNTFVNVGAVNFEIADGIIGSSGGAGGGGYSRNGNGGYITFVEFI